MATEIVKVPDIGADSAEVIEILVALGDQVEADQSLVTMESDKASMEVPCPTAGTVKAIKVSIGDQLSEGMDLIELELSAVAEQEETAVVAPSIEAEEEEQPSVTGAENAEAQPEPVLTESLYSVPDIGAEEAEIIDVSVSVGDDVAEGDSIVVAESDKASLEIPAETSGTVVALHVREGDKVKQGSDLITIRITASVNESPEPAVEQPIEEKQPAGSQDDSAINGRTSAPSDILVPDMGSDAAAEVIEVPVSVGDVVQEGETLVVAETDKASVEVPADCAGEITAIHVSVGSHIVQGDRLVTLIAASASSAVDASQSTANQPIKAAESVKIEAVSPKEEPARPATSQAVGSGQVHAGPAVRKLARELGVDLTKVSATGQRHRILKDDVHAYVKQQLQTPSSSGTVSGAGIPEIPAVDWGQFGDIDIQAMSRINKVTAANMSRNWLNVPHVTQFDDADVTDLEAYRGYLKPEGLSRGIKMTPLAFLLKASAVALKENPKFNTAIHSNGEDLVERKFFHIAIAVDTPLGLMVPVIRDVDQKDIWQLATEVSSLAAKAKEGKLSPKEMQGASFTISSLGAIGGKGFTPIVPAPQVGILGVSKTAIQPVWDGNAFVPRKMMPLALSYDHRVVNGADAGKFMTCMVEVLGDLDRIWNG